MGGSGRHRLGSRAGRNALFGAQNLSCYARFMSRNSTSKATVAVSPALLQTYRERSPQIDDRAAIARALYAIARECGWTLGEFHWSAYPMSFHWVAAAKGECRFAILLELEAPVVALSRTLPDYRNLDFFDDAGFAAAVRRLAAKLAVLPAADLRRALTPADEAFVASLGAQFASDTKYWRPETVGDVIFNWWD